MKVVIIGAGSVGRSIAAELIAKKHEVILVERSEEKERLSGIDGAGWVIGDACELSVLSRTSPEDADVLVAATGDDKVNLVVSLLAKTEFGVPLTVGRVSHPSNEWMFDDRWGVDVAVSTPRIMTALVEEAVSVGRVVNIFSFAKSATEMVEITVPSGCSRIGATVGATPWPSGAVLVGIVRDGLPLAPTPQDVIEAGDELMFLAEKRSLPALQALIAPGFCA